MKNTISIPLHDCLQETYQGGEPSFDDLFDVFQHQIPLLQDLEQTPQDPDWHAEGNVHIHSRMTLESLYKVLSHETHDINAEQRMLLILASSLHDIAKAFTTRYAKIDGKHRLIAPKHAQKGRSYLSMLLGQLGLNLSQIEQVVSLVGFHHHPRRIIKRTPEEKGVYWSLARQVNPLLLNLVCQADLLGRICNDQSRLLEDHDYFVLYQQEALEAFGPMHNEWSSMITEQIKHLPLLTQKFIHTQGRREAEQGIITHPQEVIARSYQYRDRYAQLYLMCGPSGVGKSTWIQKNYPHAHIISMDEIRQEITGSMTDQSHNRKVFQVAFERLKASLPTDKQIVWDATTLRKDYRDQLLNLADKYKAFTQVDVFLTPIATALKRNRNRERELPEQVIQKQYQQWEFPQRDEAHVVNYMIPHKDKSLGKDLRIHEVGL
jgi:predicted kinase